ncbi:MAG: immune inhibitor A [Chloroflexi bacterium]|nr:immune inhibitor A [Chloroflexota bacterium]
MNPSSFLISALLTAVLAAPACAGGPDDIGVADSPTSPATEGQYVFPTGTSSPAPTRPPAEEPTAIPGKFAVPTATQATPPVPGNSTAPSATQAEPAVPGDSSKALGAPILRRKDGSGLAAAFPDAPDRDLYRLAAELIPGVPRDFPRVVNPEPVSLRVGRIDTFSLINLAALEVYQSDFELRLVSDHAYWYVESGQSVRQQDLERSAAVFEEDIYPRVTAAFGTEWNPGVDNDPHLNILNGALKGPAGYFTSTDEYPQSVFPFSNQREIIYVNSAAFQPGTAGYLRTIAHELQHVIHWNADPSEDTWVNEGLAELAATIAGYGQDSIDLFLGGRPTSLIHWPVTSASSGANYGAASLFMHYLSDHFGGLEGLHLLLQEPGDGTAGIDAYLEGLGYNERFLDVFQDWIVANILDQTQGTYSYSGLDVRVRVRKFIDDFSEISSVIPQYSAEYIELTSFAEPLHLRFKGTSANILLPIDVGPAGCWWSNSGDSIDSRFTRTLDLSGLEKVTLKYEVWYSLEDKWDYAYVQVSVDGGQKWEILEAPNTSPENPVGTSFGMGYTGDSGGWIAESVDLTPYRGKRIQLRFQYVTDDAINGAGLCLRRISIPQLSSGALDEGWQAEGFVHIDNRVRQDYIVQVIELGPEPRVTLIPLDDTNSGELEIPAPERADRLVVAVAAVAPKTKQPASYTLSVEPAN